ncbi:MAG TPA: hypothetical protein VJP79_06455 [Nitrososphaera sp.]|nr:hypothetical protein [Nitrososphaera sp.]
MAKTAEPTDDIKRKAVFIALNRLGEEMFEVIRYHLHRSYAISFDPDDPSKFSLEQLHFALSVMLGQGTANNVLRQVTDEIRELMQYDPLPADAKSANSSFPNESLPSSMA